MGLPAEGTIIQSITLAGYGPPNVGQIGRIETDQNGMRWRCIQIAPSVLYIEDSGQFGTGIDGDLTIAAGTTTIVGYRQYRNLQVNAGAILQCELCTVKVQGILLNNGTIMGRLQKLADSVLTYLVSYGGAALAAVGVGNPGRESSSTASPGSAIWQNKTTISGGCGGGGGGGGGANNGGSSGYFIRTTCMYAHYYQSAFAAGGVGAAAGTAGQNAVFNPAILLSVIDPTNIPIFMLGSAGSGGGSGGMNSRGTEVTATSGKGGDGGRGGNFIKIICNRLDGIGTFNCDGENGENGGNAVDCASADGQAGGGGGGGGGAGGTCIVLYRTSSGTVVIADITANGGAASLGGTGLPTAGGVGGTGGLGANGFNILQQI